MWHFGSQVKVTFWFWLMYPPPRKFDRVSILQSTPSLLPLQLSDSMPERETGEFQFQMDMDIWTRTPSTTPLQPKK